MTQVIKKILGQYAGMDVKFVNSDLHLNDDLLLDENDIDDVLSELEDYFGVDFEDGDKELVYVADLIAYVKKAI